jgi:transglutaminase-like putative cysteine protease
MRVRQHYRYVYSSPISAVKQRLVMIPPDRHTDQVLEAFDLDVRGTSGELGVEWQTDLFGNRICHIVADRVDEALGCEARFVVRREESSPAGRAPTPEQLKAYLSFTALTAPDIRIHEAALEIASRASDARECIDLAHDWAAAAITYQVGVTGTQTPAAMALHLRQGVCQDYAHILLSVLRCLGIPARYVSGHLLGEGAPHAWIEAYLNDAAGRPGPAVLPLDPTHHRVVNQKYITVAVGRDFADVSPTSGVFTGASTGRLHWSKQADVINDDEVAEVAA